MKKILLITPRYPYPVLGGDKDRFVGIAKTLSKKNKIDIICASNKYHYKNYQDNLAHKIKIFKINFFCRIFYSIFFLFKANPIQISFYYSKTLKVYIQKIMNKIVF